MFIYKHSCNFLYFYSMKAESKKKEKTPMEKLTEGYEKFIKDKKTDKGGKQAFEKALKEATKQRGSK